MKLNKQNSCVINECRCPKLCSRALHNRYLPQVSSPQQSRLISSEQVFAAPLRDAPDQTSLRRRPRRHGFATVNHHIRKIVNGPHPHVSCRHMTVPRWRRWVPRHASLDMKCAKTSNCGECSGVLTAEVWADDHVTQSNRWRDEK